MKLVQSFMAVVLAAVVMTGCGFQKLASAESVHPYHYGESYNTVGTIGLGFGSNSGWSCGHLHLRG